LLFEDFNCDYADLSGLVIYVARVRAAYPEFLANAFEEPFVDSLAALYQLLNPLE
jgi:hypothetical protein